mgnify:CR=1 FL=1
MMMEKSYKESTLSMSSIPLISVIIPTYNRAKMLQRAIKSVLAQDYRHLEIIVVDDASQDNTVEIIKSFKDSRIKIHQLPVNRGVSIARNEGIKKSTGEYLAFLDSDDEFMPNKLRKCLDIFQEIKPSPGMVFSNLYTQIDGGGDKQQKIKNVKSDFINLSKFPGSVFLPPSTWIMTKQSIEKVGYFDQNIKSSEDLDLFARIVRTVPVYFFNEPLVNLYVHKSLEGRDIDLIADDIRFYLLKKWLPEMKKDPQFLSDFYYCAGKHHVRLKSFSKAIPWLWKALLANPKNNRIYFKIIQSLAGLILKK